MFNFWVPTLCYSLSNLVCFGFKTYGPNNFSEVHVEIHSDAVLIARVFYILWNGTQPFWNIPYWYCNSTEVPSWCVAKQSSWAVLDCGDDMWFVTCDFVVNILLYMMVLISWHAKWFMFFKLISFSWFHDMGLVKSSGVCSCATLAMVCGISIMTGLGHAKFFWIVNMGLMLAYKLGWWSQWATCHEWMSWCRG